MNRRLVLVILAALVLVLIVAVGISVAAGSNADFTNKLSAYTTGHTNARDVNRATCESGCHQTKSSGQDVHARHKRTMFLSFKDSGTTTAAYNGCGLCHGQFTATGAGVKVGYEGDLSYADTNYSGKVRKQVSAEVCRRCHGGFTASSTTHLANSVTINTDCLSGCHKPDGTGSADSAGTAHNKANVGQGTTWINRAIVDNTSFSQYCTLCHGQDGDTTASISNRVWYQVEETNSTGTVGP